MHNGPAVFLKTKRRTEAQWTFVIIIIIVIILASLPTLVLRWWWADKHHLSHASIDLSQVLVQSSNFTSHFDELECAYTPYDRLVPLSVAWPTKWSIDLSQNHLRSPVTLQVRQSTTSHVWWEKKIFHQFKKRLMTIVDLLSRVSTLLSWLVRSGIFGLSVSDKSWMGCIQWAGAKPCQISPSPNGQHYQYGNPIRGVQKT